MAANDPDTTPAAEAQAKELASLAQTIRDYQKSKNWSDTQICKRFAALGSTKTYARILGGDFRELDVDRWLLEYRSVAKLLSVSAESDSVDAGLFDDLTMPTRLRLAFLDIMNSHGNNRLVIVEGCSGSGKSKAAFLLALKYGSRVILAEADETWKSLTTMLGGLLRALGCEELPGGTAQRKDRLFEALRSRRVCLIIDEAQHLGPASLNMVKSIINQTPGEVILLGLGTLLRRLETTAYYEALQLTRNRMSERINLDAMDPRDVELLVKRRLGMDGDAKRAALMLVGAEGKGPATRLGHFAFVDRVCREAKRLADGDPVTLDLFAKAITKAEAAR